MYGYEKYGWYLRFNFFLRQLQFKKVIKMLDGYHGLMIDWFVSLSCKPLDFRNYLFPGSTVII